MEIVGLVTNYDWGKIGQESLVAQLAAENDSNIVLEENTRYSEMCMGSYPSGQAKIKSTGAPLQEEIPFLLKVLSIDTALSIQIHPDKEQAEILHMQEPKVFTDDNHKPIMVIALTPFVALCGFRPVEEIVQFLQDILPLRKLVATENQGFDELKENISTNLRECYVHFMRTSPTIVGYSIESISNDYWKELCKAELLEIFNRLKNDFPHDIGVLSLFFLNVVRLQPGEAMYMGANQIYAYISGDCVECSACSDNLIRAGLTAKFKDTLRLAEILDFTSAPSNEKIFQPISIDNNQLLFEPPVKDFAIRKMNLTTDVLEYTLTMETWPAILLVLSGKRTLIVNGFDNLQLKRGSIIFIPSASENKIQFKGEADEKEEFVAFLSYPNLKAENDFELYE